MSEKDFLSEVEALMTGFWLTDLANFSALVFQRFSNVNWAGFYLSDGKTLRLGPFVGKPACTEVAFHRGVCGAAFTRDEVTVVEDVHRFPGHITCDPDSRSELVVPIRVGQAIVGVFDVDSPKVGRFTTGDAGLMEKAVKILISKNPGLGEAIPKA